MALMYGVGVASSSNFLPTMIKRLTKDAAKANLYTVGPNLVASVSQLTLTFLSDRYQQWATFTAGSTAFNLIANLIPVWLAANVPTTTGRAGSLGMNYMAMNLAGIVSSLTFRAEDGPVYAPALISVGVTQGIFMVVFLLMR
ncbi:hypothetical protein BCR34DRAFT_598583 [Clohesyomyces aquaticus]|uniref:Major facilitator superfamily domain-containing protein n=1 Tax=Clohesyomyces aquaticus TaxID=1231657 RepID=A0A1Y1ZYM6_9PLEO|nr:hypothetical protein BCR34DRAFT_598583 [Clohesyomyces aquaticus]